MSQRSKASQSRNMMMKSKCNAASTPIASDWPRVDRPVLLGKSTQLVQLVRGVLALVLGGHPGINSYAHAVKSLDRLTPVC